MATIFSHAMVAMAVGNVFPEKVRSKQFFFLGALCAVMPDCDTLGYKMGVPYESMFGHRGFTHSLFFAVLLAVAITFLFYRSERFFSKTYWVYWLYFFLATALHPVVDAMTSGGLGVAFFSPFKTTRYFFPFRPIRVCHIGISDLFNHKGIVIFRSEFVWLWVPSLVVIGGAFLWRLNFSRLLRRRGD